MKSRVLYLERDFKSLDKKTSPTFNLKKKDSEFLEKASFIRIKHDLGEAFSHAARTFSSTHLFNIPNPDQSSFSHRIFRL